MGKKKFIDKKNAVTYSLVYEAGDEEDEPVDAFEDGSGGGEEGQKEGAASGIRRVLVPLEDLGGKAAPAGGEPSGFPGAPPSWLLEKIGLATPELPPLDPARRKEILEMGFPDDGYDYLKHLREARPDRAATELLTSSGGAAASGSKEGEAPIQVGTDSVVTDAPAGPGDMGFVPAPSAEDARVAADVKVVDARRVEVQERQETEQATYDKGGHFPMPKQKMRQGKKK